jgi:hypothetical protein
MREDQLQAEVVTMAQALGLYVFHSTDPRRDIGPGFPDLVICGLGGVAFVELKSSSGRLEYNQTRWRNRLTYAGAQYRLYGPRELLSGEIRTFLLSLCGSESQAA